jgi:hypothetical protein
MTFDESLQGVLAMSSPHTQQQLTASIVQVLPVMTLPEIIWAYTGGEQLHRWMPIS